EAAALGSTQLGAARSARRREIPRRLFRCHLDLRVERYQAIGDRDLLDDFDPLRPQRLMLHVRHRNPMVDARDAEPVKYVRHQFLKPHVLHAGDALGAAEIHVRAIAALLAFARVIDEELSDLAERSALFAVVDDDPDPALLRCGRADFDAMHEIGPAGADIRAEDIGTIAFVVYAAGNRRLRPADPLDVAEQVNRCAADRR